MKKSNFVALILGTVSCVFFALGMCMTLLSLCFAICSKIQL